MPHNAYALFFAAVLIGCFVALCRSFWAVRNDLKAVMSGDEPACSIATDRPRLFRIRPRLGPLLPIVKISICRI